MPRWRLALTPLLLGRGQCCIMSRRKSGAARADIVSTGLPPGLEFRFNIKCRHTHLMSVDRSALLLRQVNPLQRRARLLKFPVLWEDFLGTLPSPKSLSALSMLLNIPARCLAT
jgi:hypothetical protein